MLEAKWKWEDRAPNILLFTDASQINVDLPGDTTPLNPFVLNALFLYHQNEWVNFLIYFWMTSFMNTLLFKQTL